MEELPSRSHAALTGTGNHGYQRHSNMTPLHSTRFWAAVASARTFLFIICQRPTELDKEQKESTEHASPEFTFEIPLCL